MRTVLLSRNAFRWQFGGAEQLTFNFAKELKSRGMRPIVITRVPELLDKCADEGIITFKNIWLRNETRRRWLPLYYLLAPLLVLQYAYLFLRYNGSLLLAGSRDDQIFGTTAAYLLQKPSIWMDHADMKGILGQPFRFLRRWYFWAMSRASKIIVVSKAERSKIFKYLPSSLQQAFVLIINGAIRHSARPLSKPKAAKIISYIGRIEVEKGVLDLIKAMSDVVAEHRNVELWLGGKGSAEKDAESLIDELGLQSNVKLLGHLDNIGPVLAASDIFAYPTHHDASPLAPIEAMLSGLPVVASNVGGVPEIVTDGCGILTEPSQPQQIAAALNKLLGDPSLMQKLQDGASRRGDELEFSTVFQRDYLPLLEGAWK